MAVLLNSNPFERLLRWDPHCAHRLHTYRSFSRPRGACLPFHFAADVLKPERPKFWFSKKEISGFKPSDVKVKVEEGQVVIHARIEDGEDYFELKKHVKLPSNVKKDSVKCVFRKGFVHMIGVYDYEDEKTASHVKKNESRRSSRSSESDSDGEEKMESKRGNVERKSDDDQPINVDEEHNDKCDQEVSEINTEIAVQNKQKDIGFYMPGFDPEDITIKVTEDNLLTVEASSTTEMDGIVRCEEFVRSVQFPESVNMENLKTFYKDGYLEIKFQNPESDTDKVQEIDANKSSETVVVENSDNDADVTPEKESQENKDNKMDSSES